MYSGRLVVHRNSRLGFLLRRSLMLDLLLVPAGIALFLIAIGYASLCERL